MSRTKFQTNGILVFEADGFNGGRNNCKDWSGFARIQFEPPAICGTECAHITVFDNMSSVDGDYIPVDISLNQLEMLKRWIELQLIEAAKRQEGE